MTESEWLVSDDPAAMLRHVIGKARDLPEAIDMARRGISKPSLASDRKLRLFFACACARRWHDLTTEEAAEVARVEALEGTPGAADYQAVNPLLIGPPAAWAMHWAQRGEAPAEKAALLRCLFGNPFRPVRLPGPPCPDCDEGAPDEDCDDCGGSGTVLGPCPWVTPAVTALARAIHDDRDWAALPVLADALEEAGCPDAALLGHLRETCLVCGNQADCLLGHGVMHVRGCWALDLLLAKE